MMLLLDIGNTRVKWATAANGALRAGGAVEHHGRPQDVLTKLEIPSARTTWVSHVFGNTLDAELVAALRVRTGATPTFARTHAEHAGLRVAYAEPERLGVDRWLAMLALWIEAPQAFCVVNAGTALTLDAVNNAGRHLGGLIAPGLSTSQNAIRNAARFGRRPPDTLYGGGLGQDTDGCVRQGALHACAGLVERGVRLAPGRRVISGGDAALLRPHLPGEWELRPDLVLEGLHALARSEAK